MHSSSPSTPDAASTKPKRVIAIVAAAFFMEVMDATIIATSLPAMAADLGVSPVRLSLAFTAYLAALAIFIPASGWLANRVGIRRVIVTAIVVFTLGSIGCGLSVDLLSLTVARFIQGMGGAMMVPVGRLLVLRTVERRQLISTMVWLTMPALTAPVIGPPLGGFITTYLHWRGIFWLNVPIGIVGICAAMLVIPRIAGESRDKFDAPGFVLTGIGLTLLLMGLTLLGDGLLPTSLNIAAIVAGLACLTLYVWHARRAENPIIGLNVLGIHTFRSGIVGLLLFRAAAGAIPFILPVMFQVGFGLSAFNAGLLIVSVASGGLAMKLCAERILKWLGFRRVLIFNALICGAVVTLIALIAPGTPYPLIIATLVLSGFFRSLQFSAINALSYVDVPDALMSRATSLFAVIHQSSLCAGVALSYLVLEGAMHISGSQSLQPEHFPYAFAAIGLLAGLSGLAFIPLDRRAGAEVSGHAG